VKKFEDNQDLERYVKGILGILTLYHTCWKYQYIAWQRGTNLVELK